MRPSDTTPEAAAVQASIFRRMGPEERVRRAVELSEALRQDTLASIRARHPEYSGDDARRALLRLIYGDALVRAAFPRLPLLPP